MHPRHDGISRRAVLQGAAAGISGMVAGSTLTGAEANASPFALGTDKFLLQLELGFDFLLLTDGTYEGEYGDEYSTGSTNMVMIHIGAGMYFFPVEFLQTSIELTWINPVHGRLYENAQSPSTSLRSPGGELCLTPALTFFIPLPKGNVYVGIGARVPTGDINSTLGNFTWIANAGWRW